MTKFKQFVMVAFVLLFGVMLSIGTESVKADTTEERIAEGILIGNVDVGGMTAEEAKAAVEAYMEGIRATTFTLIGPTGSMEATAAEMGLSVDASDAIEEALTIAQGGNLICRYKETCDLKTTNMVLDIYPEVDKQATAQLIYAQVDNMNIKAIDNGLVRENGEFTFVPGQTGTEVNIVESVYAINDFFAENWDGDTNQITLVTDVIEPRGTQEEFAKVKDLLGTYSTDFSSSKEGRKTNVQNGCSKINGTVMYPGDIFSVYDTISPFNEANGYAMATAYASGKVVESVGGGICQVSTTLYNAIIRAELDIIKRYNHSMIVNYVEPSEDAAIASGLKDFQFVNSTDYPVYIEGYCSNGIITINVYGVETRPANRVVSFESEVISESEPQIEYTLSEDFEAGYWKVEQSEHRGMVARLWKVVTVDGVEESREIFNNSTYIESPKYVTIGIKGGTEAWLKAVKEAIKAGDEAVVKATVKDTAAVEDKPETTETDEQETKPTETKKPDKKKDTTDKTTEEKKPEADTTPDVDTQPVETPSAETSESTDGEIATDTGAVIDDLPTEGTVDVPMDGITVQ